MAQLGAIWADGVWDVSIWDTAIWEAPAPTISNPTVSGIQATSVDLSFNTDKTGGTGYYVVTSSATQPSAAQIQAGNDHTGSAATASGNTAASTSVVSFSGVGGLTEGNTYYAHFNQVDSGSNDSNVISTASFVPSQSTDIGPLRIYGFGVQF